MLCFQVVLACAARVPAAARGREPRAGALAREDRPTRGAHP